jgi:hypothetical protein
MIKNFIKKRRLSLHILEASKNNGTQKTAYLVHIILKDKSHIYLRHQKAFFLEITLKKNTRFFLQ